ncbi:Protein of unknown function [Pyronema omphalodes CBS 100304]|uniref:Uncharacterized protein n=1 Tax=Pyronema omphalodes (strain CBS 100304) TaxID=1076935 RepID=U4LEQ9_PYROM|nr:Protein of unknown function [Pyronema omphalodes CBS 100304]
MLHRIVRQSYASTSPDKQKNLFALFVTHDQKLFAYESKNRSFRGMVMPYALGVDVSEDVDSEDVDVSYDQQKKTLEKWSKILVEKLSRMSRLQHQIPTIGKKEREDPLTNYSIYSRLQQQRPSRHVQSKTTSLRS